MTAANQRVLVLGGGGAVGTAWMAGLLLGLQHSGIDMRHADQIVGTSAGAIVGAALAVGHDLSAFADPRRIRDPAQPLARPDPIRMRQVFATLATPALDPTEARRRVGASALADRDPQAQKSQLAARRALIGTDTWPDRELTIIAVDAASGRPVVWDRATGVPLVHAVTASSAFPGASPPIQIGGRYYIDGGLRSTTNADLVSGAHTIVVIEPLAHISPRERLKQELTAANATAVLTIAPDRPSRLAFGPNLYDPASWSPAYEAGLQQGTEVVAVIRGKWTSR